MEEGIIFRLTDCKSSEEWLEKRKYGNGASEAASMCNADKYQSQTDLWEIKAGIREGFKGNEATERGHRLEPVVRDRFMAKYGWLFDLDYHEFGMYYRTDLPMLFATLDGILIAKSNGIVEFSKGCILSVKKGEKVILEIKNPAPRDFETYKSWDNYPTTYKYQAAQQMLCTGIHKHIAIANVTGDFQKGDVDERFFITTDSELESITNEIKATAPKFWFSVQRKERPVTVVKLSTKNLIPLKTNLKAGDILDNFNDVVSSITEYSSKFKGLVFTEENLKSGKEISAEINKRIDDIESVRKGVKKQWEEPLKAFEERCKKLTKILEDTRKPIADQIKEIEDGGKQHKEQQILELIEKTIKEEYPNLVKIMSSTGGLAVDPKWTNKSTNWAEIKIGIKTKMDAIQSEWQMLYAFKETVDSHTWSAILAEYLKSKRNVQSALAVKESLQKARELEEPKVNQTKTVEQAQPVFDTAEPKNEIKKVVEFTHTDPNEFKKLIKYLVSHGFKCREVK